MTAPNPDAAEIAKKLTAAQRRFLVENPYNYRFARGYKPGERLVALGLLDTTPIGLGERCVITSAGLAVRSHLQAERDGGRDGI